MKISGSIHFILSLVLILAIGFMEYSIIDDSTSLTHVASQEVLKKEKKSHELVIARNMQMDDDDEDALIKYTPHEFYHCNLMLHRNIFVATYNTCRYLSKTDAMDFSGRPIADLICAYRI